MKSSNTPKGLTKLYSSIYSLTKSVRNVVDVGTPFYVNINLKISYIYIVFHKKCIDSAAMFNCNHHSFVLDTNIVCNKLAYDETLKIIFIDLWHDTHTLAKTEKFRSIAKIIIVHHTPHV